MPVQPILIAGDWRSANASGTFKATNPATTQPLPDEYPISTWADCDAALAAASLAAAKLRNTPAESIAKFLEAYAARIEACSGDIVTMANLETGLPRSPRLSDAELPRTTNQLRQAAAAAREGSWKRATIDTKANIRSYLAPLGPVAVFGPNNFPLAFNSIAGGDFASAIAAGCPVIAKAHSSHPGTTRLLAALALAAMEAAGLPPSSVQMIYRTSHADGERLAGDPRLGGIGYTGGRTAGLTLKKAADAVGKPIYLELSSVNPVVILPGALRERADKVAEEFTGSCLMGAGQFCTNPGIVFLIAGSETERFLGLIRDRFAAAPVGTLLAESVLKSLETSVMTLRKAGAQVLVGGATGGGAGHSHSNTLLKVSGRQFLEAPEAMQTEAFGNVSLVVVVDDAEQLAQALDHLEGNLTGCFYTHTGGEDDAVYDRLAPRMRPHVGRLLNDKMPTGVAVSPAMNHGGPFPATGHPGFTAVGIPASMTRFGALECFDNVRPGRLPVELRDKNPTGKMWRLVDGAWTQS